MARSYVKLYGPPIIKGLKALENLAVEMSKITTMRFYSALVPTYDPMRIPTDEYGFRLEQYLTGIPAIESIPSSERIKLISRASDTLGEHDFFFDWGGEPTKAQVLELIEKIDEALAKCGCKYTIITK